MNDVDTLLRDVALIVFRKVTNNKPRTIIATQNLSLIPENQHPKGSDTRNRNPNIIRVYSFGEKDWRSFYRGEVLTAQPMRKE